MQGRAARVGQLIPGDLLPSEPETVVKVLDGGLEVSPPKRIVARALEQRERREAGAGRERVMEAHLYGLAPPGEQSRGAGVERAARRRRHSRRNDLRLQGVKEA